MTWWRVWLHTAVGKEVSCDEVHQDMNVSEKDFLYLKEQVTAKMIAILTEEQGLPLEQAIDKVYSSELFQKLGNAETGLFFQSPRYLLSYIQ